MRSFSVLSDRERKPQPTTQEKPTNNRSEATQATTQDKPHKATARAKQAKKANKANKICGVFAFHSLTA